MGKSLYDKVKKVAKVNKPEGRPQFVPLSHKCSKWLKSHGEPAKRGRRWYRIDVRGGSTDSL